MVALVTYAGLARGTISEIVFKSLDKKPLFRG